MSVPASIRQPRSPLACPCPLRLSVTSPAMAHPAITHPTEHAYSDLIPPPLCRHASSKPALAPSALLSSDRPALASTRRDMSCQFRQVKPHHLCTPPTSRCVAALVQPH